LPSALLDKPVPEFALPPVIGREESLSTQDLIDHVSLVNVFASWCVPCRAEHPLFMELSATAEVPLYGINYKDPPEQARAWLDELGDPYDRIGADINGRAGIEWGVYGVPETFVIAPDGTIVYRHVGPITRTILQDTLLPIVRDLKTQADKESMP
jgi:cytochrome c biogenesis protein CcmG/thiol:disulfide interchange protein DsbE